MLGGTLHYLNYGNYSSSRSTPGFYVPFEELSKQVIEK